VEIPLSLPAPPLGERGQREQSAVPTMGGRARRGGERRRGEERGGGGAAAVGRHRRFR
jgi:hypothetical protein